MSDLREQLVDKMVDMGWLGEPWYRPHAEQNIDELMPLIREALAEAWDGGWHQHNALEGSSDPSSWSENPYRVEAAAAARKEAP